MKVSEMVSLLEDHHQYVPSSSVMVKEVVGLDEVEVMRLDSFHNIIYNGDQLTEDSFLLLPIGMLKSASLV